MIVNDINNQDYEILRLTLLIFNIDLKFEDDTGNIQNITINDPLLINPNNIPYIHINDIKAHNNKYLYKHEILPNSLNSINQKLLIKQHYTQYLKFVEDNYAKIQTYKTKSLSELPSINEKINFTLKYIEEWEYTKNQIVFIVLTNYVIGKFDNIQKKFLSDIKIDESNYINEFTYQLIYQLILSNNLEFKEQYDIDFVKAFIDLVIPTYKIFLTNPFSVIFKNEYDKFNIFNVFKNILERAKQVTYSKIIEEDDSNNKRSNNELLHHIEKCDTKFLNYSGNSNFNIDINNLKFTSNQIIRLIHEKYIYIYQSMTGSGKSVTLPTFPFICGYLDILLKRNKLDSGQKKVFITQPVIKSAKSIDYPTKIGFYTNTNNTITGYRAGGYTNITNKNIINSMTEGSFLIKLQNPESRNKIFNEAGVIILDEVHQNTNNMNLIMAILAQEIKLRTEIITFFNIPAIKIKYKEVLKILKKQQNTLTTIEQNKLKPFKPYIKLMKYIEYKSLKYEIPIPKLILTSATISINKYKNYFIKNVGIHENFIETHKTKVPPNSVYLEFYNPEIFNTEKINNDSERIMDIILSDNINDESNNYFKLYNKDISPLIYPGIKLNDNNEYIYDNSLIIDEPKNFKEIIDYIFDLINYKLRNDLIKHVIIFLSKQNEINKMEKKLKNVKTTKKIGIKKLFRNSDDLNKINLLDYNEYDNIIFLATNAIETGVTLNDISLVIDTGFENNSVYIPKYDMSGTFKVPTPFYSLMQRKGRAGRTVIKNYQSVYHSIYSSRFLMSYIKNSEQDEWYDDIPLFNCFLDSSKKNNNNKLLIYNEDYKTTLKYKDVCDEINKKTIDNIIKEFIDKCIEYIKETANNKDNEINKYIYDLTLNPFIKHYKEKIILWILLRQDLPKNKVPLTLSKYHEVYSSPYTPYKIMELTNQIPYKFMFNAPIESKIKSVQELKRYNIITNNLNISNYASLYVGSEYSFYFINSLLKSTTKKCNFLMICMMAALKYLTPNIGNLTNYFNVIDNLISDHLFIAYIGYNIYRALIFGNNDEINKLSKLYNFEKNNILDFKNEVNNLIDSISKYYLPIFYNDSYKDLYESLRDDHKIATNIPNTAIYKFKKNHVFIEQSAYFNKLNITNKQLILNFQTFISSKFNGVRNDDIGKITRIMIAYNTYDMFNFDMLPKKIFYTNISFKKSLIFDEFEYNISLFSEYKKDI